MWDGLESRSRSGPTGTKRNGRRYTRSAANEMVRDERISIVPPRIEVTHIHRHAGTTNGTHRFVEFSADTRCDALLLSYT